jgi:hypothetical protein
MVNLCFCLLALVLFTIGFRLVKMGNPYKRGGGDSYTKRRMYRMLGWMMWTTAGVMVTLTVIAQLNYDQLPDTNPTQAAPSPGAIHVRTVKNPTSFIPNMIHATALQADASSESGGATPGMSLAATGSLDLAALEKHQMSISPSLLKPVSDDSPAAHEPAADTWARPESAPEPAAAPTTTPDTTPDTTAPLPGFSTSNGTAPAPTDVSPPHAVTDAPVDPNRLKQLNAELAAADAITRKDASNVIGYLQRGNAYGNLKQWAQAKADYQHALQLNSKCTAASFNLAEIEFMQGHYDTARPGFMSIVNDGDFGDLAKYKVFLCDLFGGHEQTAAEELAVFNQVGSEASYYFANVAWSLYHKKSDDAKSWWDSANSIFPPQKVQLYAKPLIDLGYVKVAS